ncbi:MAG: hypothetical protein IPJ94_09775 [Chloroflexi bacterium]|nr:hypothetical protein [Chloroflexota bacterium]
MSWQAMTAVSRHSKQEGQLLRLILHLAEFADAEGNVDPAPNQDTLAAHFGCTPRTIRNRLNELAVQSELTQTRIGSGPGNPSAYKILLPMPETAVSDVQKAETKGGKAETNTDFASAFQQQKAETKGGKAETNTAFISAFQQEMVEIKAEILALKAEILSLKAETKGGKGGKGGNERRKGHSTKSADDPYLDPYLDPIDPEETTTNAPAPNDAVKPIDVVVAVLSWLGFVGDGAKEPLTAESALAWAFWMQLNRARLEKQGKDPLAITIAAWRRPNSSPPADCLGLASAWLSMTDSERSLTLAAAAQPLFEIQAALPENLWPFDIPGRTLHQLQVATNGRFLPPALLPAEAPDDIEVTTPVPASATPVEVYQMPPETAVLWKSVLSELEPQMVKATFNTWLKGSKLKLNGGSTAVVYTRNAYAADWINGRLQDMVSRTLSSVAGRQLTIEACEEPQV